MLNICQNYSKSPKNFLGWLNQSKGYRNPIPSLLCDDSVISDDAKKASCFNRYFISDFTVEDFDAFPDVKSLTVMVLDLIASVQFTPQAVFNLLHSLSVNKACGPDLIPASHLKEGAESICVSLSYLFQLSFERGMLFLDYLTIMIYKIDYI